MDVNVFIMFRQKYFVANFPRYLE